MEAAFFDLDKTVIAKASILAFGRPFYRAGLIPLSTVFRALYAQAVYLHLGAGEERMARLREAVLKLTRGWEQDRVAAIVRETLNEVIEPIIFKEALELIQEHKQLGHKVVIVSASPKEIVEPLALYLGADTTIASSPLVDQHGRYTGAMRFYAYGPSKAEAMVDLARQLHLDLAASFAYSDSYTDAPMLEAVGNPVAVNPDRPLLKLARERRWEVRRFSHRVRMEGSDTRQRLRPTLPLGAGAAVAVAGIGALAVGLRIAARRRLEALRLLEASSRPTVRGRPSRQAVRAFS